jgi:hypothetical protein
MPYSRIFKKEKYEEIQEYLVKLQELKENEALVVSTTSSKELDRFYWLFRDYFHVCGISSAFKCSRIGANLFIGKEIQKASRFTKVNQASLSSKYDNLMRTLIVSPEPRKLLCQYIMEEKLSLSLLAIILDEFSRVLGE